MRKVARGSPRDKCPSCKAPIVGTNPTLFPSLNARFLHSLSSFNVLKIGILEFGSPVDVDAEAAAFDILAIARRFRADFAGAEVRPKPEGREQKSVFRNISASNHKLRQSTRFEHGPAPEERWGE